MDGRGPLQAGAQGGTTHTFSPPIQACTLLLRTLAINGSVLRPELLLQLAAEAPTSCRDEIGGERALLERTLKVRRGGGGEIGGESGRC